MQVPVGGCWVPTVGISDGIILGCLSCRHLDKSDFTVFLQRYCLLSDTKLSEIADDMIAMLSQPDKQSDASDDDVQQQLQALSAHQVCLLQQQS